MLHSLKKVEMNGLKGIVQADFSSIIAPEMEGAGVGAAQQQERCKVKVGEGAVIAVKTQNLTFMRKGELGTFPKVKDIPKAVLRKLVDWSERIMLGEDAAASAQAHRITKLEGTVQVLSVLSTRSHNLCG